MNAIILLTVLGLTMPIFGEETQVKKQDKRGILGLGHAGFGGSAFQGDSLTIGTGYGQSYLGDGSLGHGFSVPSYPHSAPLYSSQYSGGLGYGGLGYGGRSYSSGGLGYSSGGLGYSGIRSGYGTAGFGYGAGSQGGHGIGLSTGYRGW
ncbi:keratin-associated protein 19-2-like [Camponotus floridanus]|uniref:keratin-associated protein 19-2-like n=1 Tax=Camponotus floridanus TaxID=104421 RepID=UPI000DC6C690|nr:keratin-associated protein 19-2-like [Camponotus floridanus]